MKRARAGRMIGLLMVSCVVGLSGCAPDRRQPASSRKAAAAVEVVGRRVKSFKVRLSDGRALKVPDSKQHVALWLGDPNGAAQAAGGLAQLAAVLPEVRFVVVPVKLEARARPGAPQVAAAPLPVGTPRVAVAEARAATAAAAALGRLLGGERRWNAEWWLVDPAGKVVVYGRPGDATPIMEADLAWPFISKEVSTPAQFKPTPIARLSPDGANRQWPERLITLWRARLLDAYRQHGHRDAKWDEAAEALLEQRCRALAGHDTAANSVRIAELADAVLARGCDDALVLYQCARAYDDSWQSYRAERLGARVGGLASVDGYPVRTRWLLSSVPWKDGSAANSRLRDQRYAWLAESSAAPFAAGEQRLEASVGDDHGLLASGGAATARTAMAQPGCDLWLRAWLDGRDLHDRGWSARGGDVAARTAAAQFDQFSRLLEAAAKSLGLAWKLHPDYPETARQMLSVAQGQGDPAGCRMWLERALAADIDSPALSNYYMTLWPRWGGTHAQIAAVGHEAAESSLLATLAPLNLWRARQSILSDQGIGKVPSEDPAVGEMLTVLDGMLAASSVPERQDRLRTWRLALLVRAGRGEQAAARYAELSDRLDPSGLPSVDNRLAEALADWLFAREPNADDAAAAAKLLQSGHAVQARDRFRALLATTQSRLMRRYVADQLAKASDQAETERGTSEAGAKGADGSAGALSTAWRTVPIDSRFGAWGGSSDRPGQSDVTIEEAGALVLRGAPVSMVCKQELPPNAEVSLEVSPKASGPNLTIGLIPLDQAARGGPLLSVASTFVAGANQAQGARRVSLGTGDWHRIQLRVTAGSSEATVDDVALPLEGRWSADTKWQLVLNTASREAGAVVQVRNVRWRAAQ